MPKIRRFSYAGEQGSRPMSVCVSRDAKAVLLDYGTRMRLALR